ncbi:NAD(P)-binding protein [Apiospora kogelbergensis]|uniref:NAD(P)-binding protein n=1 Tax=Apiospora kogelbergensis TaxID=1337665 RepID=A0AAW0Q3G8_9PEZI
MSPYTAETTADEVAADCQAQIAGKTVLVTGATPGGLGAAFALAIAKQRPACIVLATRSRATADETAAQIHAAAPDVRVRCVELDLGSQAQVRAAAAEVNALDETVDVLVNNAGVMACPYAQTVDGIERQFGTNFVGHFLFTNLLLPKMLARGVPVRVVNVSSDGHRFSHVRFEDLGFEDGKVYDRWTAYAQSKTANMLFSLSLAEKLGNKNLVSVSLHPGVIWTNLGRDVKTEEFSQISELDRIQGHRSILAKGFKTKTLESGVATHVVAAFHPSLDAPELNGSYLQDCNPVKREEMLPWGRDPIDAERLWKVGEQLVSQSFAY